MPSFLIVGASRGLGFAWLTFLCRDPNNTVIGVVRDKDATRKRLAALDLTETVHLQEANICNLTSLMACAVEVSAITGGSLDVLINNAAITGKGSAFMSLSELQPEVLLEDLNDTFQTSVIGTANLITSLLPLIRRGNDKKFVGVSSMLADMALVTELGLDHAGPYSVSKVAANALLTRYHTAVGQPEDILFMSISPGIAATAEKNPDDGEIQKRADVREKIKAYAPHFTKPLQPIESVAMQWKIIKSATVETHGGKFVSHTGKSMWL